MGNLSISSLAIPSVILLISFLSFTSQFLFTHIGPCPLTHRENVTFNTLITCIFITYFRACFTDPGGIPKNWRKSLLIAGEIGDRGKREAAKYEKSRMGDHDLDGGRDNIKEGRWCRKCDAAKPSRTHHCKSCMRCIPRMDHHCPWTASCVSHTTLPHFIRFLFYAVVTMIYLQSLLWPRLALLWARRHIASTLGPSAFQLLHLFALTLTNSFTLLILTILLVRNIYGLALNTTTIEFWEIERHEAVLRRQRAKSRNFGGRGEDVGRTLVVKQEFPYDVGIWRNLKAGMGGSPNVLQWFWPLAATPPIASGLEFETNGFEDPNLPWPPPDPDHIPRRMWPASAFANSNIHDTHDTATRKYQSVSSRFQTPYHLNNLSNNQNNNRNSNGASSAALLSNEENKREESAPVAAFSSIGYTNTNDNNNDNNNQTRITAFKARQQQAHMVSSAVVRQRRHWNSQQPQARPQPQQGEIGAGGRITPPLDSETVLPKSEKTQGEGESSSSNNSRSQWRNADGERLADFGVDDDDLDDEVDEVEELKDEDVNVDVVTGNQSEDGDGDGDDNVPLGLLIQRRRTQIL